MAWHWKPAIRSPGKFSRPFIRPCKKNRSLLASLLNNGRVSFPKFPNPPPFHRRWQISSIRHLHISHNALFCLPKFCIIFFSFLLGITAVPREIKNNSYAKFWGANKVHMGMAYQLTLLALCKFVSPITYPSRGIRWLLCECELNTICNNNWIQSNKGLICNN